MSRHVPDERLDVIHAQFSGAIRQHGDVWVDVGGTPVVPGHDLISLLDELRRRRQSNGRLGAFQTSKTTEILKLMGVGDTVEIEPITQGALSNARKRARLHLEAPDAVWRSQTLDNGLVRIERMPDGSPVYDKRHNPAVATMARMAVGQVEVLTTLRGKIYNGVKIQARRLMDNSEADWRCQNLASGNVRCERIR